MRRLLKFSDLPAPVALDLPPGLVDLISNLLPGWDIASWRDDDQNPVLTLEILPSGEFAISGSWMPQRLTYTDQVDAACAFIAELICAYINELPDKLCLHAAAAVFNGRLLVFLGTRRAGKSTLSAAIAALGNQIAGDDIVLIDPQTGEGIAGGFSPRLRLPIPKSLSADTKQFIDRNCGPVGKQYAYLSLDEEHLAARNQRFPIGAFILLDREESGPASLAASDAASALQTIIQQNFARLQPPAFILDRLFALIEKRETHTLSYASADVAARLLERVFSSWPDESDTLVMPAVRGVYTTAAWSKDAAISADPLAEADMTYRRRDCVFERLVNSQSFLANDETGRIIMLNRTATAIWGALSEPASLNELVELVSLAFPGEPPSVVEGDVRAVFKTFIAEELITSVPQ